MRPLSPISTGYICSTGWRGPPSIENGNYARVQPTADGSHWDGITIYAANPVNIPLGNQNTFSNFNVYSQEGTTIGTGLGADTCMYFTALSTIRPGAPSTLLSLAHFKNLYCEPETGPHASADARLGMGHLQLRDRRPAHGRRGRSLHRGRPGSIGSAAISITPLLHRRSTGASGNTADFVTNLGASPRGT